MKILIPYEINTTGKRNPFLFLLARALRSNPDVEQLGHGFGWLREEGEWDIIHLHWPEALAESVLPGAFIDTGVGDSQIEELTRLLSDWKRKGARILLTVHNTRPHAKAPGAERLYNEIYRLTDGFIHMGRRSEELFEENVRPANRDTSPESGLSDTDSDFTTPASGSASGTSTAGSTPASFVIPHGDYSIFPDRTDRQAARKKLNERTGEKLQIEPSTRLILAFGAIRNRQELELGIDAFSQASLDDTAYLMAGKLPYRFKSNPKHFSSRKKLYLNRWNKRILTDERIIMPEEVQYYLNSADLLFIPRLDTLNSGNVALGFTFGRVVAGPDVGVIGEILKETGNPVFNPKSADSAAGAIKRGLQMADEGHGEANRSYCKEKMNWNRIAEMHLEVFKELKD